MTIETALRALDFHDSLLRAVDLRYSQRGDPSCTLELSYYDWEGNQAVRKRNPDAPWRRRRLHIVIGHLAHIEFLTPDPVNPGNDIAHLELGYGLAPFRERHEARKRQFPKARDPLFDDGAEAVSLRFLTHNFGDEAQGHVWVVGSAIELRWSDDEGFRGQTHIPVAAAKRGET